jgi:hydroxymethylglutaryl-CoA reductase
MNDLKGLYKINLNERTDYLSACFNFDATDKELIDRGLPERELGDGLIENFFSYFQIPVGLVRGVPVNGDLVDVCMAVEETSVVAALSNAAKAFRGNGSIVIEFLPQRLIGQLAYHIQDLQDRDLMDHQDAIEDTIRSTFHSYFAREGAYFKLHKRILKDFISYDIEINPLEVMGANLVTQMAEQIGHWAQESLGLERPLMGIVSNHSETPSIEVTAKIDLDSDSELDRIVQASLLAEQDPYRAATHNKGILNGIDPIMIVTGNDWRANNAVIHSYAGRSEGYRPLCTWTKEDKTLVGKMALPLQVGILGGVCKLHPFAQLACRMMKIEHKRDLMAIIGSIGILQNYAALKALTGNGIVQGHMGLHIKNIVRSVGDLEDSRKQALEEHLQWVLKYRKKVGHQDAMDFLKQKHNRQ